MKETKNKAANPDRVPFWKLLAWNTRPISLGAVTIIIGYLSIYCTDTLGMPAALVGTLLMASKIFDGITDLVAGWLVDNTNTRWGKGRPYEFSIIGVWICMFLLFSTSVQWSLAVKAVWVFIMYTLIFSIFSTLLNACETPYIIRAFKTPVAITKVSAYGGILITVGCMIVSISFPIFVGTIATSAAGWRKLILMYAVPLIALGILRFLFVKEEKIEEGKKEEKVSLKNVLQVVKGNRYAWLLGIAALCPQLVMGMSAATYYFTWNVGDITVYSTIQAAGMLTMVVMFIFPVLMKRFSGMQLTGAASAIGIVGYMINFIAGNSKPLLIAGFLLSGIAAMPLSYMRSPIVMQISDYNESKGLPRMEGTISSIVNFLCKIGSAVGSFLLGVFLSAGGYDGSLAAQSDKTLFMIRALYSLVPIVFMVVVILAAVAFRPLDKMSARKEN